jgi:tRNA 2-thiouridine synthesizing protein A
MLNISENVVSYTITLSVDARGLQCPMPLLKAKQGLNKIGTGEIVEVFATDAGSYKDFHAFARQGSHELLLAEEVDGEYRYILKKGLTIVRQL